MEQFEFQCVTNMIFGKSTEEKVGLETSKYGKNVMLVYGGGSIKKSGLYNTVLRELKSHDISVTELSGVKPNPVLSLVKEGIAICLTKKIDFLLAVGGGSVIDTAKGIALGACYDGDVWDFYLDKAEVKKALPLGVILTIPAAGSECSTGTVITNEETMDKNSVDHNILRPVFAICNPELTFSLPNYQTAAGCSDIIAHIMERYFTNAENVMTSDYLCEGLLKTIMANLPIVLKDNNNYAARAEIMWAGSLAHNNLLGAGRIDDWANHDMEHPLSAEYNITHGAGLSITFSAWLKYAKERNPKKLVQFAVNVLGIPYNPYNENAVIDAGILALENFYKNNGLPIRLHEVGIDDKKLEKMAAHCTRNGAIGNYLKLEKNDVVAIYRMAL